VCNKWARKCFLKSANHKFANPWARPAITNLQISEVCESANSSPFIANYIKVGYRFIWPNFLFLKFDLEHLKSIFVRIKIKNLRICGSFKSTKTGPAYCKSAYRKKILDPQITNPQISALTEGLQIHISYFKSPQIFGFAICGNYLRTARASGNNMTFLFEATPTMTDPCSWAASGLAIREFKAF